MGTNNWPADFRYISKRLVREIVDQEAATRTRWHIGHVPTPGGGLGIYRDRVDRGNIYELVREATKSVSEITSTLAQGWGTYIRTELSLSLGALTVYQGWKNQNHVNIAAMMADVEVPGVGRVFLGLFGSASNYANLKDLPDELGDVPSDVDGLYTILDRTREPGDPEIKSDYLHEDIGHSILGRSRIAVNLLKGSRYEGFRTDRFDLLLKRFYLEESMDPYDLVILGAPIWVATPNTF